MDVNLYSCVAVDIATDEVIITDERVQHIKNRHPGDIENYFDCIAEMIANPDYIIQDEHACTAMVMKEFVDREPQRCFRLVLRLAVISDGPGLQNSIITFLKVRKNEYQRMIRNKKVLYKRT